MFQGRQEAVLKGVRAFEIHGQTYYDIQYEMVGGERGTARLPREVIYADPKAGDEVVLHFLMSMVTQVEKVTE